MATGIQISPSSDITVGTTAISNGTEGRVLFQGAGNVVQQDPNFTYDNTLKRLGLRAVGTAATDIPFNIQNSAGTVNLLQQNGVGSILARSNDTFSYAGLFYRSDSANGWSLTNSHLGYGQGTGIETVNTTSYILSGGVRALSINTVAGGTYKSYGIFNWGSANGPRLTIGENTSDPQLSLSGTGNLGLGTYTAGARLDVRAQGALSTDIAFRVRNSADSLNFAQFNGDGTYFISSAGNATDNAFSRISDGRMFMAKSGSNFIELNPSGANRIYNPVGGWGIEGNTTISTQAVSGSGGSGAFYYFAGTMQIGGLVATGGARNSVWISNGVAPTATYADRHWYYSADIVAGNAAPHFRTEAGDVVKLYKETTAIGGAGYVDGVDDPIRKDTTMNGYTLEQVVKALQNFGLLA